MGRFLFVLVLFASSTALDAAFGKGGIYSLRVRLRLLNCRRQANFWLAAAMAATAIA